MRNFTVLPVLSFCRLFKHDACRPLAGQRKPQMLWRVPGNTVDVVFAPQLPESSEKSFGAQGRRY
jgi:hypothetical protein